MRIDCKQIEFSAHFLSIKARAGSETLAAFSYVALVGKLNFQHAEPVTTLSDRYLCEWIVRTSQRAFTHNCTTAMCISLFSCKLDTFWNQSVPRGQAVN